MKVRQALDEVLRRGIFDSVQESYLDQLADHGPPLFPALAGYPYVSIAAKPLTKETAVLVFVARHAVNWSLRPLLLSPLRSLLLRSLLLVMTRRFQNKPSVWSAAAVKVRIAALVVTAKRGVGIPASAGRYSLEALAQGAVFLSPLKALLLLGHDVQVEVERL